MRCSPVLVVCFLPAIAAQTAGWAERSALDPVHAHLPNWLRFGGEYRVRWEGFENGAFRSGNSDLYLLHRVRLNMEVRPSSWFRIFAQGQDARVWDAERVSHTPPFQDSADLRQAYFEIGGEAHPFTLRAGRQEITLGEERLVGASNWANAARSFDAVRADWRAPGVKLGAFASAVVVTREGSFDRHVQGNNLHAIYAVFERVIPRAKVEPYFLWRVAPAVRSEFGMAGKLDSRTVGFRIVGVLDKSTNYVTEVAMQRGSWAGDAIGAWAGHFRVERVLAPRRGVKLRLEYNHASGDRDPADRRLNTFDVLYPTPHDKYGLADQVGWKNVEHAGVVVETKPRARLSLQAKFHTWWLANARDGLYNAPGTLIARDVSGRSGRHVGEEIDGQLLYAAGKQLSFGAGVGHIFPAAFVKRNTPGAHFTFPYVAAAYTF